MQTTETPATQTKTYWDPPRCVYCGYPLKRKAVQVSRIQKRYVMVEADSGLTHLCGDR